MRRRTLLVVLALTAACASSEERPEPTTTSTTTTTTTATSTSTSSSSTSTTSTTTAPPTTTTTARGRADWPSARAVDEALGLELTVTTSSQDIGPGEPATFVFRIRNTSTDDVVYDANTDFIALDGGEGGGHWGPFCGARTAVLVFETLAPGASIGGHDVAYPGDRGPEPCPRPPAGEYQLVVRIYGCRQPPRSGCEEGSVARVAIPVRQR